MLTFLKAWLATHRPSGEKDQDAAEDLLLSAFIALAIVVTVTVLGTNIAAVFNTIGASIAHWL